jgi:hypothetical protein
MVSEAFSAHTGRWQHDGVAELMGQLESAEQVRDELEAAFPTYLTDRNLELPLAWPSAA